MRNFDIISATKQIQMYFDLSNINYSIILSCRVRIQEYWPNICNFSTGIINNWNNYALKFLIQKEIDCRLCQRINYICNRKKLNFPILINNSCPYSRLMNVKNRIPIVIVSKHFNLVEPIQILDISNFFQYLSTIL